MKNRVRVKIMLSYMDNYKKAQENKCKVSEYTDYSFHAFSGQILPPRTGVGDFSVWGM